MPGRGNAGAKAGGRGKVGGLGDQPEGGGHGRSELSPGHRKREAGASSARDFAPGRGGESPGQVGREPEDRAAEQPEASGRAGPD
jgi:hypothetical protein